MKTIPITRGLSTLVDDDVYEWASRYKWCAGSGAGGKWYAARASGNTTIYLHRIIAGEDGLDVDHRNGDTLDNRRENLRSVTHQRNQQNRRRGYGRTGERNVYLSRQGRYQVKLCPKSGPIHIGTFDTLDEAVEAAKDARARYFPGAI